MRIGWGTAWMALACSVVQWDCCCQPAWGSTMPLSYKDDMIPQKSEKRKPQGLEVVYTFWWEVYCGVACA